jgi:catechol 2,3-dioxygenase-like lactoylglutathione lyase family enzyme
MITAINHVQLAMPAGQEPQARIFYHDVLGLEEVPKPPALAARGGCWFTGNNARVVVHLGVEADFRPARKAHPAFSVDDLEQMRNRLAAAGYTPVQDPATPQARRFHVFDPFGNRIEFILEGETIV